MKLSKIFHNSIPFGLVLLAGPLPMAHATPQSYQIAASNLAGDTVVTGSFVFDPTTETYTDWNIETFSDSTVTVNFTFTPQNSVVFQDGDPTAITAPGYDGVNGPAFDFAPIYGGQPPGSDSDTLALLLDAPDTTDNTADSDSFLVLEFAEPLMDGVAPDIAGMTGASPFDASIQWRVSGGVQFRYLTGETQLTTGTVDSSAVVPAPGGLILSFAALASLVAARRAPQAD